MSDILSSYDDRVQSIESSLGGHKSEGEGEGEKLNDITGLRLSLRIVQTFVFVGLIVCIVLIIWYIQFRHPCQKKPGLYRTHQEKVDDPTKCARDSIQLYLEGKHEIEKDYKCKKPDPTKYDTTYLSSLQSYFKDDRIRDDYYQTQEGEKELQNMFQLPANARHTFDTTDPYISELIEDLENRELQSKCYDDLLHQHPNDPAMTVHRKRYAQLKLGDRPLHNHGSCPEDDVVH